MNKLIVFDIDGTLTDSVKQHQKAFAESLIKIGVKEIKSDFKSFKHHSDSFIAKEIFESELGKPFSQDKKDEFESELTKNLKRQKFTEIKGAKKLIDKIRKENEFGVCFATGSLRKPADHKLKSIGINFEEWQLVASDDIYERELIVQQAIQNSEEHYNTNNFIRILSVGDGPWDLLTAKKLGLEFIGIGVIYEDTLKKNGAKLIYKDLSAFKISDKNY